MKVKCPGCQQDVEWHQKSAFRPFCSKRCQLIDLGQWANEDQDEIEQNPFFFPDPDKIGELETYMQALTKEGNSIGAQVTVVAKQVPVIRLNHCKK